MDGVIGNHLSYKSKHVAIQALPSQREREKEKRNEERKTSLIITSGDRTVYASHTLDKGSLAKML